MSADVDGMFLLSDSTLCQIVLRMISSHLLCFTSETFLDIEWYKVTGDVKVNADACALKYIAPTRRKKERWDSSCKLPMLPGASNPPEAY